MTFIGITLVLLMAVMWMSQKELLLNHLTTLENKDISKNVEQAVNAIEREHRSLEVIGADWATWDDAYRFIADGNQAFVDANLVDSAFSTKRINLMMFIDNTGRIVYAKGFDLRSNCSAPVPESLSQELREHPQLLRSDQDLKTISGIISLSETPVMVSLSPVLPSNKTGNVRGTLIVGRFLDAGVISDLQDVTQISLAVQPLKDIGGLPDYRTAVQSISSSKPVAVRILDQNRAAGYTLVNDILGKPVLALRIILPRDLFNQGQTTIYYTSLFIVLISLVFGSLTLFLIEKLVLSRIFRLSRDVNNIGDRGFGFRLKEMGSDELGVLTTSINRMLQDLEQSHQQLVESDRRFRRITDNMLDIIAQVDLEGRFEYLSPSYRKVLGSIGFDPIGKRFSSVIYPADSEIIQETLKQVFMTGSPVYAEFRCQPAEGPLLWMETVVNPLMNEKDECTGVVLVARDVTLRKEAEEQIHFISLHDSLTGLYNRTYFEQEMLSLEGPESLPVAMMICDLDGLKFINDTLGHKTGDALLLKAAQIIRDSCSDDTTKARIGGDEFALLFKCCSRPQVESVYARIKKEVAEHCRIAPDLPLAISIGFALRHDATLSMADLFREADNNMYREKLHSQQSGHSGLISSLMQALQERDFITGGHVERMEKLTLQMGKALELSHSQLNDLLLFTRFHDIGKVGIPDAILFKPGPLTPEEYDVMKRHSEIGYRIARAAADLQPVAELILKHHEWWNGQGYPLGLKGQEIPLECRIIAIIDAYDAMTSERPYRQALSREQAIAELKRYSGTRFEPELVELLTGIITSL
ncbi:MAG: HD domain-containing phosphohydrolase [Syntrophomonas sp.]